MRIYVASSWRNKIQPSVVVALREAGHEVYDFRNPREGDTGFHWSDIDQFLLEELADAEIVKRGIMLIEDITEDDLEAEIEDKLDKFEQQGRKIDGC